MSDVKEKTDVKTIMLSDKAARLATQIAATTQKPVEEVIEEALANWGAQSSKSSGHNSDFARIWALTSEMLEEMPAGVTSNHEWLYDENGLPR